MQLWLGVKEEPPEEENRCIADKVQEYIDGHYADKQLTVGALAEMFEVSTPWLSRNFKKEKDCGVLEYIGQVRMEHAKELLLSGMSVTDTEEQVGYRIFVGGIWGKRQRLGTMVDEIYTKDQVFEMVERSLLEAWSLASVKGFLPYIMSRPMAQGMLACLLAYAVFHFCRARRKEFRPNRVRAEREY